ncbi:MAG TPA: caspase family protein [Longimicrobium sp.]|jgi:hypothetical protein|uniref:nSTAND1 domain-containing NTPase n=1 Tax=Longimicrobium sp. TaxID=2029185 RepID=UPI002ED7CE41
MNSEFNHSHAVVVGINAYTNNIRPLRTATQDARALAVLLASHHGYQVTCLTDAQATGTGILAALQGLQGAGENPGVSSEDRVLFYFAGHGVVDPDGKDLDGYLVPQDAARDDDRTFLPMRTVHDLLLALPSRHLLVVMDCCFAGAMRWSGTRDVRRAPRLYRQRYERFVRDPAYQLITSAAFNERAVDVLVGAPVGVRLESGTHSPFATALLRALAPRGGNGGADPPLPGREGVITAAELYIYLADSLPALVPHARQSPGLWPLRRESTGEYVFRVPGREPSLPEAPPLDEDANPYRGLEAFGQEHRDLFFGRDEQARELREKVETSPLTVVVGASGSGKSSLVRAGLLARIADEQNAWLVILPAPTPREGWPTSSDGPPTLREDAPPAPFRPGESPLVTFFRMLRDSPLAATGKIPPEEQWTGPSPGVEESTLAEVVSEWWRRAPGRRVLLVVDQLEELVTQARHQEVESGLFMRLLWRAKRECPDAVRIVLTLRSDFEPVFDTPQVRGEWGEARFFVRRPTQDELREIIVRPAERKVLFFNPPELVENLINEVVDAPGGLPLLSFTLSELYRRAIADGADDREMRKEDYRGIGGVVGSLRSSANRVHDTLPDDHHRGTLRRIMLRMVALEGGEVARRRVPLWELEYDDRKENERVKHVLAMLGEARLTVSGTGADGEPYVEPAHDELVRGWDRLSKWITDEQANLILLRRLGEAAREWHEAVARAAR